jgi:hypothetical protein
VRGLKEDNRVRIQFELVYFRPDPGLRLEAPSTGGGVEIGGWTETHLQKLLENIVSYFWIIRPEE